MRSPLELWSYWLRRPKLTAVRGGGRKHTQSPQTSRLALEVLEARMVLTGDSPLHNLSLPGDVNVDGLVSLHDAFAVSNFLRVQSMPSVAVVPDMTAPGGILPDVMNRWVVNFADIDALVSILVSARGTPNGLAEGEPPPNLAPWAGNDWYSTRHDVPLAPSNVLANDTDPNFDALTAVLDSGPAHAAAFSLHANGTLSYTPQANWAGSDSFTYHAYDGSLSSNSTTVSINVTNFAPMAVGDSFSGTQGQALAPAASVLANDSDFESDPLTATLAAGPAHAASFSLAANGTFNYVAAAGWSGSDSFTYTAFDGVAQSAAATVMLQIAPLPTISIDPAFALENETSGKASFTVRLSAASTQAVTVQYATSDGTALPGLDYVTTTGTLTIPAGNLSGIIHVSLINDALIEPLHEVFFVSISNPANATLGAQTANEGTITDDDPRPKFSIGDVSLDEGAGTFSFPVTLSAPSWEQVRVNYATRNGGAVAGVGADYAIASGTITLNPGETSATVNVTINDDAIDEYSELFYVDLSAPVAADIDDGTGNGEILNNDTAPQLTIVGASRDEGAGTLPFTVSLSAPSGKQITVAWNTVHTTTDNGDLSIGSGTLTIPAGSLSQTITTTILNDNLDEAQEQFAVELSNPANATLAVGVGTGNIIDNDDLLAPASQTTREGTTVSLQLQGNSPMYIVSGGTYSATGLPVGLAIDAAQGTIAGKIGYGAFESQPGGVHNVVVERKNVAGDLLSSAAFTWTVSNAAIISIIGQELRDGGGTSNQVTVTGLSNQTLYYTPGHTIHIGLPGAVSVPADRSDVLYQIPGYPGGNFATNPHIDPSGLTRTVLVGIDLDQNGVINGTEGTHSFEFAPINLSAVTVAAMRTSGPAEATHYVINENDHFEVGGTFEFVISPGAGAGFNDPGFLRYKLIDEEYMTVLQEGAELTFSYTFDSNYDPGSVFVRLYNDANQNQSADYLGSSPEDYGDSASFWVMEKKVWTFSVSYSDAIAGGDPSAMIANQLAIGSNLLLRKDSPDDNRAAVEVRLSGTSSSFQAGGGYWHWGTWYDTPDPVLNDVDAQVTFDAAYDWTIIAVNEMTRNGNVVRGRAESIGNGGNELIWNFSVHTPETLVHEVGHLAGIRHEDAPTVDHIMRKGSERAPGANKLTPESAKAYDGGP